MIEFIIWLIFFFLMGAMVLTARYWMTLFQSKDQYSKNELLDLGNILMTQINRKLIKEEPVLNLLAYTLGAILAWILTLFGGLVSPNDTSAPDFAANALPNYFFQSFFILPLIHLTWPYLKDLAPQRIEGDPVTLIHKILVTEPALFFGLATGLLAINLMVWGVYHEISFLYVALNGIVIFSYIIYLLKEKRGGEYGTVGAYEGMDSDDDFDGPLGDLDRYKEGAASTNSTMDDEFDIPDDLTDDDLHTDEVRSRENEFLNDDDSEFTGSASPSNSEPSGSVGSFELDDDFDSEEPILSSEEMGLPDLDDLMDQKKD